MSAGGRRYRWLALVPGLGLVALMLAGIRAEAAWLPRCHFSEWTGWHCSGCGMTRAVRALMDGDPVAALDFNFLGVLLAPLVIVGVGGEFLAWATGREGWRWRPGWRWPAVLAVAVIGFGVLRNLPGFEALAPG